MMTIAFMTPLPTCILMDSGVGGLSVLNTLLSLKLPLNIHYIADTAFMPYGSKSVPVLRDHLTTLFSQFEARWGKGVPIALCCNTASVVMAHLSWELTAKPSFSLLDIITPTVDSISGWHQTKKAITLGVLATELTIQSTVYPQLLAQRQVAINQFYGVPCPQLAASIEGQAEVPSVPLLLDTLLLPLQQAQHPLDAVILGCTHYQFVADDIQRRLPQVPLISQSVVMAEKIASAFGLPFSEETTNDCGLVTLWTTGSPEAFQSLIPKFLPLLPSAKVQSF
ncbi:MAG: aspartate/glutamate racemase family protein [Candidatus Melainabacteria bacterium]|nr:aspartate/glutamate racemase family protein [Candidatus Melainabacteria bacterium]